MMDDHQLTNYLWHTPNPFGLSGPPPWFLVQMYALDDQLVLFPSSQDVVYRVARRVKVAAPQLAYLPKSPDTLVYAQHKLIPVTSLLPFTNWSPVVLQDLWNCSDERIGGPDKYPAWLDADDDRQRAAIQRDEDTEVDALIGEAYSDLAWESGRRISQEHGARHPRTTHYHPPTFHHDTGGSAIFVGERHRPLIDPQTRTVGRGTTILLTDGPS